ncbi:MAG: DUF423 domain-containing protein [Flavobacteriales bacterium]|nr:DUF423 domain-containing protein [Flavobacteriales bacterium]
MNRRAAIACFHLALAVSLGALGAHFLKAELSGDSLASFQTGVRYHIYHSLALLILALWDAPMKLRIQWNTMHIGMLLFSFSIYLLSTRGLLLPDGAFKWLGPITPLGGVLLIASWLFLGIHFLRSRT